MYLEGQANRANPAVSDRGFALAALLVAIAVLSVLMLVALPTWRHHVQREKEAELIFRGEQYARAIGLYQRKLAGAFPPSLDALVEQKFLRRRYKDPISGDDFEPVFANSQAALSGPGGAQPPSPAPGRGRAQGPGGSSFQSPMGGTQGPAGAPGSRVASGVGGIVGVRSKSTAESIRLYNGRNRYDQWVFVYAPPQPQPGQTVRPDQQPGRRGGSPLPGATPGTSPPGRGRGPF